MAEKCHFAHGDHELRTIGEVSIIDSLPLTGFLLLGKVMVRKSIAILTENFSPKYLFG